MHLSYNLNNKYNIISQLKMRKGVFSKRKSKQKGFKSLVLSTRATRLHLQLGLMHLHKFHTNLPLLIIRSILLPQYQLHFLINLHSNSLLQAHS